MKNSEYSCPRIAVLVTLLLVAACAEGPSVPDARTPDLGVWDCRAGCVLVTSADPLAAAIEKPDSAGAELRLAQLRLQGRRGQTVWLYAMAEDSVIAAAGPDVGLIVSIGDSPEQRQRIPLRDLLLETSVHELVDGSDVTLTISLESHVKRAVHGPFELRLRTEGTVVAMLAPWSASPPVHPLLDVTGGSTCALTTQTGMCDSVQWTIAPFAPGNPFGDFQSQPGTGASQPITITFSAPVGSATVTAVDPTFAGNQVVAYLAGVEISRQDFAFSGQPGVNIPDTKAIAGPLDRLDLIPAPAD
jgi:hypothetical protein